MGALAQDGGGTTFASTPEKVRPTLRGGPVLATPQRTTEEGGKGWKSRQVTIFCRITWRTFRPPQ